MREYKNRYGDVFTFTKDDDHNILWEGNFEYCRFGMPNDYQYAYSAYLKNGGVLKLDEFKKVVHNYNEETSSYDYPEYIKMVKCLEDEIDMVDPSGGPYLSVGMPMDSFGFKDSIIEDFQKIDAGYKIIIKK
jgi:hypothetical protein